MTHGKHRSRRAAQGRPDLGRKRQATAPSRPAEPILGSAGQESRFGVACSLWQQDRREEAAGHFRELLKLDPDDRQFVRYWLAACLLDLQQHDELQRLLEQREEPTAAWRYAQTLLAFRLGGDSDQARHWLQEAQLLDKHFPDYLLGDALVHADRPVQFGREPGESTHSLARLFLPAWRSTPGAASWVRRVLRIPLGEEPGGMPFPRSELRGLPRRNVTWHVGLRLLDEPEPGSQEPPVWIMAIANAADQELLYMTVIEEEPAPAVVWREILSALRQPLTGTPHRPAKLIVPRARFVQAWQSMLADVGVACDLEHDPKPMGDLLEGMAKLVELQRLPSLPSGVDPSEFPQTDEVWQADFFHLPTFISNDQIGVERPWAAIVLDKRSQFVLSNEMLRGEPTPEALWDHVVRSMAHPGPRAPMRPSVVEVSDSDGYDFLKPQLNRLGVECVLLDELPELHAFCRCSRPATAAPRSAPWRTAPASAWRRWSLSTMPQRGTSSRPRGNTSAAKSRSRSAAAVWTWTRDTP